MNDLVLLTALLAGPAYGYALKKTAGLIFGSGALHNNVVYPFFQRSIRHGWVEQKIVAGDRGQQRKQYRITPAGRKYLIEQVSRLPETEAADEGAFLLRVALFDVISARNRQAIVAARKSFLVARAAELAQLREGTDASSFGMVALERVRERVSGELEWIGRIESETGGSNAHR